LVDRPPPHRYRIVERGGRLEVLDTTTGERPQSAAERMAAHDAAHGHAALRYDRLNDTGAAPPVSKAPAAPPNGATTQRPPADPIRAALSERAKPWSQSSASRPQLGAQTASEAQARPGPNMRATGPQSESSAASPPRGTPQTMVTSRWWDSKGPRTLRLGAAGRKRLSSGFVTALVLSFFLLIALLVVQPALLLIAGFALFRFGGTIIGPLGARLIDEAIKADGLR
jgi:hypothetical protein